MFLPHRGIAALPHSFTECCTKISPRGPKDAKKENKMPYVSYMYVHFFDKNQNFLGYGILIQTLNTYYRYLRKYEVFTLTQLKLTVSKL